jgi:hypothetical protein
MIGDADQVMGPTAARDLAGALDGAKVVTPRCAWPEVAEMARARSG